LATASARGLQIAFAAIASLGLTLPIGVSVDMAHDLSYMVRKSEDRTVG